MAVVTFEQVRRDPEVHAYIVKANEMLSAIGFTEHGLRHVGLVAQRAMGLMAELERPERMRELAGIAALLHDIGNIVNRHDHGQTSALLAHSILSRMGMPPDEIAIVMSAIGNHEEEVGNPVHDVSAALILADKSDVHRTRVYNRDVATFDIHDRVNYAVTSSELHAFHDQKVIRLSLVVDTSIIAIMEYFEIFLTRMIMCRRAAELLGCRFELVINENRLL
ncbi:metal-dependent HD superfamily phosphatase/phosphodiesterase [Symbiobacterium terraclitae]|uniref:Metal-dependent HD superfamily phosphatase/phosphodiesterase n=1 Tax=Symbiobacterium terraclitae TaxID=557451 RepID=A0ABS4JRU8_9FIRM|nr:HD domain-containing protein [Symbiobacterium terraclitae]MBP2018250.1 metal-dependent HD superfamily phosphatase/phosphodiesterase [Symbiobacterium terraclitae]